MKIMRVLQVSDASLNRQRHDEYIYNPNEIFIYDSYLGSLTILNNQDTG